MKQNRYGQWIVNWHRPYDHSQLSRGYLRCRATAWQREYADDCMACDDEGYDDACYDNEWSPFAGDGLTFACYAARELLEREAPRGQLWQFFVERGGWPAPVAMQCPDPVEPVVSSAQLAQQLANYRRQLLGPRVTAEWLPVVARQTIAATDLRPLQALAARSAQGRAALLNLLVFRPYWVRSLSSWEPQGSSSRDQIATLITHLLAAYPVPPFLSREWMSELEPHRLKWLCWAILLGQGQSLHQAARYFGWELPRRLQHYLYTAPPQATALETCLYAEVLRLGGSVVEFRRLRLAAPFAIDPTEPLADRHFLAFWRSSVLWLIQHRQELSDQQAQLVLFWALHQHTEALRNQGRPFTLIGRSVQRVLAADRVYQGSYQNPYGAGRAFVAPQRWMGHGWDWSWEDAERNQWSATELTSSEELAAEGQAMHHCVASYAGHCAAGMAAIVSLCCNGERRVTVEIHPLTRRVVQARGPYNGNPSVEDQAALDRWLRTIVV
ncbi:MAG: hypothetical protein HGA45_14030 [Chloroflexales bacterium]|nr:hypothetical protein [Chloroflexales bacterium]